MKNKLMASIIMLIATATLAVASPFSDVSPSHWSYEAVKSLTEKGILEGYPDGTFHGEKFISRYHLALITAKMLSGIETRPAYISKADIKVIEKLTIEFADELSLLGVKVTSLQEDLAEIRGKVKGIRKDVDSIKEQIEKVGIEKIKISGDVFTRNYSYKQNGPVSNRHDHRTESMFRVRADANIDKSISAHVRWNLVKNSSRNAWRNEWDGRNKGTGDVDTAYFQFKNVFNSNDRIKLGRSWYQQGHGFVFHDYADAISYSKNQKDLTLTFNVFFERDYSFSDKDYLNIWNLNANYNIKNHQLYLGFYYNTRDCDINIATGAKTKTTNRAGVNEHKKESRIEIGSIGKLSRDNKLTYDLAGVYSQIENTAGAKDSKGWLGHAAISYDSQDQLSIKLAYTFADDESRHSLKIDNTNRERMGHETIFEDLYLSSIGMRSSNIPSDFSNLQDIKLQLCYTLKNDNRHGFRIAYDNVTTKDKNKPTRSMMGLRADGKVGEINANVITAEYTYQLAKNTRVRLGYQNLQEDGNHTVGGVKLVTTKQKLDLFFTEIYARF